MTDAKHQELRELLPLYALGILPREEAALVEKWLHDQPQLRPALQAYQATAGDLLLAARSVAPSPHVRVRLLASVGAGRFEGLLPAFRRIFDLTVDGGRALLAWIDDPSKWQQVMPHFAAIHFAGGPACVGADTGFVRLAPHGTFPYHAHRGEEVTLVLAGTALTSDGQRLGAGDEIVEPPGTAHDLTNVGDEDFIYATKGFGLQFGIPKPAK
jgi:mannose-6-phosphate isomerase-like protein (cupin superfamily)